MNGATGFNKGYQKLHALYILELSITLAHYSLYYPTGASLYNPSISHSQPEYHTMVPLWYTSFSLTAPP